MSWLTDQITLNEVHHVVQCFYDKVIENAEIGHFFSGIENFDNHIKDIAVFWWLALGGNTSYLNQPAPKFDMLNKHRALGINNHDLDVWLRLFKETLNTELKEDVAESWEIKLDEIAAHLKTLVIEGRIPGLQIRDPQ